MPESQRACFGQPADGHFSLLELLIVIVMLTVLVSLLLPMLVKARESAQLVECKNRLRQIGLAFALYADDFDEYLAHDPALTSWSPVSHQGFRVAGVNMLAPYLGLSPIVEYHEIRNLLGCSAYASVPDGWGHAPYPAYGYATNTNPEPASKYIRTYRINDWLGWLPASSPWVYKEKPLAKMSMVREADKLILAGEGYDKNLFSSWNRLYFNPHHGGRVSVCVHADGHLSDFSFDINLKYGRPGYITDPNGGHTDSVESFLTWGAYLHPGYASKY